MGGHAGPPLRFVHGRPRWVGRPRLVGRPRWAAPTHRIMTMTYRFDTNKRTFRPLIVGPCGCPLASVRGIPVHVRDFVRIDDQPRRGVTMLAPGGSPGKVNARDYAWPAWPANSFVWTANSFVCPWKDIGRGMPRAYRTLFFLMLHPRPLRQGSDHATTHHSAYYARKRCGDIIRPAQSVDSSVQPRRVVIHETCVLQ
jgi:hypothetical protein